MEKYNKKRRQNGGILVQTSQINVVVMKNAVNRKNYRERQSLQDLRHIMVDMGCFVYSKVKRLARDSRS